MCWSGLYFQLAPRDLPAPLVWPWRAPDCQAGPSSTSCSRSLHWTRGLVGSALHPSKEKFYELNITKFKYFFSDKITLFCFVLEIHQWFSRATPCSMLHELVALYFLFSPGRMRALGWKSGSGVWVHTLHAGNLGSIPAMSHDLHIPLPVISGIYSWEQNQKTLSTAKCLVPTTSENKNKNKN